MKGFRIKLPWGENEYSGGDGSTGNPAFSKETADYYIDRIRRLMGETLADGCEIISLGEVESVITDPEGTGSPERAEK